MNPIIRTKFLNSIIVLLLTGLLFIGLHQLFPLSQEIDQYAYLENISVKALISFILILLIIGTFRKNHSSMMTVVLGGSVGLLLFILVYHLKMVDPTQIDWLMRKDWQWQFIGWQLFRNDPWHFPIIGRITSVFFPVGSSVGYTDSIPLFAFLFKLFSQILPAHFQYMGLWLFLCFGLQGVFGALLIRLNSPSLLIQAIGALFFVLSPVLLVRVSHPALCAHWLLLAGLWMYFREGVKNPLWGWIVILGLSALTFPYLTVMLFGLVTAFYARFWLIEHRTTIFSILGSFLLLGFIVLGLWWLVGFFQISSQNQMAGHVPLGYFSMNLLAPFNPMWASLLLKNIPMATEGQYEGFNYFGVGVFIMGFWALYELNRSPAQWTTVKKLLPLGLLCLGLTLFALSNQITLANQVVFSFQSDWLKWLAPFQSSGRFFWIVNYTILFLLISLLLRRNSTRLATFFLLFAITIQLLDLHDIHRDIRRIYRESSTYTWDNPLQSEFWQKAATNGYQHIILVPPQTCGEAITDAYLPFSYLAGQYGLTINTGIAARPDVAEIQQYCRTLLVDIAQGRLKKEAIYILHPNYLEAFKQSAQEPMTCAHIDGFETCVVVRN